AGTRAALAAVRIPVLENSAVLLGPAGRRFWLAGLGDQVAYRLGPNRFRGVDDLPGTLAHVRTNDPVLLMVHEPDIFTQVPARVGLTLAGHTHGGQIKFPFMKPLWVPSAYGARYAYGHIVEQDRHMIVSGGLGTSFVPLRLGVPPEIVRVRLGAESGGNKNGAAVFTGRRLRKTPNAQRAIGLTGPLEAMRGGANGESPCVGARTTTTVPSLTRL